jgi:hypothetical protein
MPQYIKIGMDRNEIRRRAYYIFQFNFEYSALIHSLVKVDEYFDNQPYLRMQDWIVVIDKDLFEMERDPFVKGREELIKYNYYMYTHPSMENLHWIIAERQYVLDCLQNERNIFD